MYKGINTVFWGFVFLTFHVNFGSMQFLPQFIAWGFITFGILRIYDFYDNKKLLYAGALASATTLLCIFNLFSSLYWKANQSSYFMTALVIALGLLELYIIFFLFDGLIEYLLLTNQEERAGYFTYQIRYLILINIISIITENIVITFQINSLAAITIIAAFAARFWLLSLLNYLKGILKETGNENESK